MPIERCAASDFSSAMMGCMGTMTFCYGAVSLGNLAMFPRLTRVTQGLAAHVPTQNDPHDKTNGDPENHGRPLSKDEYGQCATVLTVRRKP